MLKRKRMVTSVHAEFFKHTQHWSMTTDCAIISELEINLIKLFLMLSPPNIFKWWKSESIFSISGIRKGYFLSLYYLTV